MKRLDFTIDRFQTYIRRPKVLRDVLLLFFGSLLSEFSLFSLILISFDPVLSIIGIVVGASAACFGIDNLERIAKRRAKQSLIQRRKKW